MLLTEAENEAADAFAMEHYKRHCHKSNKAASVIVTAMQSGMGYGIMVTCPYCRKEKNITEYEAW